MQGSQCKPQSDANADITIQYEKETPLCYFIYLFTYLFILFLREALPTQTLTAPMVD